MARYVVYGKNADDRDHDKIGGSSLLPASASWPVDRAGRKMLFLASVSADWLKSECGIVIPQDHVLSIFCPYQKGSIEHSIDMARGREFGCVVSHPAKAPRQEFADAIFEPRKLELNVDFETDEDEFSDDIDDKIGGTPNWLQDRFDYSGHDFVLQISGLCFGKVVPTHKDLLMGGVLYVFYNSSSNAGRVTLQYS